MKHLALLIILVQALDSLANAADWVVYEGKNGPGMGKHIVWVNGDEPVAGEPDGEVGLSVPHHSLQLHVA